MLKLFLPKYFLLALFLCLWAANIPAQEPEMIAPPLPAVWAEPPPDPDTLPPPPALEWEPLAPRGPEGEASAPAASFVPPPQTETALAPPPPPAIEAFLPGEPDPAEVELAKPAVEIWREESESPQIPARRSNHLERAYVTGNEPVVLRAQFDPAAAGKSVYVRPGRGMTLNPPVGVLTVSSSGECILSAQLDEGFPRSHIIFYCEGIKTVLPVLRAPLAKVEAEEALAGGGE